MRVASACCLGTYAANTAEARTAQTRGLPTTSRPIRNCNPSPCCDRSVPADLCRRAA